MAVEHAYRVEDHFAGKDSVVGVIYTRLIAALRTLGPVAEEAKKTSIHLARRTAFAGVQVQRRALVLTIRTATCVGYQRHPPLSQLLVGRLGHSPIFVMEAAQHWKGNDRF